MHEASTAPLAAVFPASTDAGWRKLVDNVLKGAPFENLVGQSADGLLIQPLYPRARGDVPRALKAQAGDWAVMQRIDHPDAATAHSLAMADLEGGADALALVFSGAKGAYGFGIEASSADQLDEILAGVELDLISVRLDSPGSGVAQARLLAGLAEKRRLVASGLKFDFGCDPVGAALRSGTFDGAAAIFGDDVAALALELQKKHFSNNVLMADGRPVHAGGGSEAQELAHVLASGVFYLRLLERHGFSLEEARGQISFMLAADADEFLGIAKFRALRLLWARVEQACGLAPEPVRLHAETAWRMQTQRDPHVNVLRTSMAVFAAGIGGADTVTALPFTSTLGLPDAFARRIARNSQLVLLEESHLAAVADPAAGAGGFEALTQGLCAAAWGLFREIEKAGGIVAALQSGNPQGEIAKTAAARAKTIATRRAPLTGTSQFPNLAEAPVAVLLPAPAAKALPPGEFPALRPCRHAEPFEALRDRADAFEAAHGAKPKIFLANLGSFDSWSARAGFAANAFAAGGIEALANSGCARADDTTDIAALAEAAKASGAELVCLCGSDAGYAAEAGAAFAALSGPFHAMFVAGKPLASQPPGVHYVHAGCDLIVALQSAHASLKG